MASALSADLREQVVVAVADGVNDAGAPVERLLEVTSELPISILGARESRNVPTGALIIHWSEQSRTRSSSTSWTTFGLNVGRFRARFDCREANSGSKERNGWRVAAT